MKKLNNVAGFIKSKLTKENLVEGSKTVISLTGLDVESIQDFLGSKPGFNKETIMKLGKIINSGLESVDNIKSAARWVKR